MDNELVKNKFNTLLGKGYYSFISAFLVTIIMSIHVQYIPPFMILWGISWIIEYYLVSDRVLIQRKEYRFLFYLFIIYYLWQVVGLIYSHDLKMGLLNLFGRLSLIVFPLVLIFSGEMIKNKAIFLIRTFAAGTFFYILFCFGYALYRSLNYNNGLFTLSPHPVEYPWMSYFYGIYLTINQHPSYISMYVLLSIFICFESWFDQFISLKQRILWLVTGFLLVMTQYFLSSRAGLLICLTLIPSYFIYRLRKSRIRKFAWIGIVVIVLALLPIIVKNNRVGEILNKQVNSERKEDPRLKIWESTLKIAKNNLLIGVGIGDVRSELVLEYQKTGKDEMAKIRLNAHNQFLEVLLENGIVGIVIFLSIFICMFYIAYTDRNLLYGIFIIMIFIFFMFETALYRLAGVSFFSLFSFLLLYVGRNTKSLTQRNHNE